MENKSQQNLLDAYNKGYRVIDGQVFYKGNNVKGRIDKTRYLKISIRNLNKERCRVPVHRLLAYQKYGNKIFEKGIHVRHLDSNSLNNLDRNIQIGTPKENNMDKSKEVRLLSAINAASYTKIHNHTDIVKMYNEGMSYSKIMQETGIKSKGTISFIIRKSIESKNKIK